MRSAYSEQDEKPEYWFNTKTGIVEVGKQSAAVYRLGPFKTREEAERALATIRARAQQWREENEED